MSNEKKNDGGPAFPSTEYNINGGYHEGGYSIYDQHKGMSLRDYFATKAMAAIITTQPYPNGIIILGIVSDAYLIADGMLKAREQ